jgi:hypothetical protein
MDTIDQRDGIVCQFSGDASAGAKVKLYSGKTKEELKTTAITSLVRSGNVVTMTQTAHGLAVGQSFTIVGADDRFNGTFRVESVTSSSIVTYNQYGPNETASTPGVTPAIPSTKRLMIYSCSVICDAANTVQVFDDTATANDILVTATAPLGSTLLNGSYSVNSGESDHFPVPFGVSPGKRLSIKASGSGTVRFSAMGRLVDV